MKAVPVILLLFIVISCDKIIITGPRPSPPLHQRNDKPRTPISLGTIRGYFGEDYRTFSQHIEKVQPVDSFSNCYFYGTCKGSTSNQINLIRCDSAFVFAIYIMGYPLDSLPETLPVPSEYGKYTDIQFYPFQSWNWNDAGHYSMSDFYGSSVFITDKTDDILTGTFKGTLRSANGDILPVTEGEFKIKIFRKDMSCDK